MPSRDQQSRQPVVRVRQGVWTVPSINLRTTASINVRLRNEATGSGSTCRRILEALPAWFGVPRSFEDCVAASDRLPAAIASVGNDDVGILTWLMHTPLVAEVYVLGVVPDFHHQDVDRRLLCHVESSIAKCGVNVLQVKTLSPRTPDDGYERTRSFYLSCGFRPVERVTDTRGQKNPALVMFKPVRRSIPVHRAVRSAGTSSRT